MPYPDRMMQMTRWGKPPDHGAPALSGPKYIVMPTEEYPNKFQENRTMKKMLSFLLMFAIMLLPISAFAAPGDAILLRQGVEGYNGSTRSMVEIDGTLYLLT